jgi:hypothetical protein
MSIILDRPLDHYDRERIMGRLTANAIESQLHPMLRVDCRPDPAALVEAAWQVAWKLRNVRLHLGP